MRRLVGAFAAAAVVSFAAAQYDVRGYGAKGDGITKDTAAIQAAFDAAAAHGGGTVYLPPGRYISGTIHLRSNVSLHIPAGATLLESPANGDFDTYEQLPYKIWDDRETTYFHYALLAGENVHDVAIYGEGTIDGNRPRRGGPKPIALKLCQRISIRGLTFRDAPNYTISFLGSDYIDIEGVTILNAYADGIDPDSSRYVRIRNCYIDAWDDTICPKASHALGYKRSVENLTVTNCVLTTNSNHFKFGTESGGDFKNIAFTNSACYHRPVPEQRHLSGVAIESADGSNIDGVVVSNIVMQDVYNPIFIHLGNRGRGSDTKGPGSIKNVSISDIVAVNSRFPSSVTGIPGSRVERVSLENIQITMAGGEQRPRTLGEVPDPPAKGPECDMFGPLPAYGLYARHVDGLVLKKCACGGATATCAARWCSTTCTGWT
jgi:polygalacturonase